jgi:hypothetical protein
VSQYISRRDGAWRLWLRTDLWPQKLWRSLRERVAAEGPSRHPRTAEFRFPEMELPLFLKIFYGGSPATSFKDFFRRSKAVRSLLLTERLAALGFSVPVAIGAGEERCANWLRRSFVATLPVHGCPVPIFLRDQLDARAGAVSVRHKRALLARLAREIRRLHDLGFIHGDLVPGNIFIAPLPDGAVQFTFMDNDRTRRYPTWVQRRLCRRNLVQLNRFPLAGISLQDRMRFFHTYVGRDKLLPSDRRLVRWLEQKTRQRRAECDAVNPSGSFRRLMRWDATAN